jgi:hypothetical protein
MKVVLKLAAALGVLTLSACVVAPWPGYYQGGPYGYYPAPPAPPGGYYAAPPAPYGGAYGPRYPRR